MDRREGRKRPREVEEDAAAASGGRRRRQVEAAFEDAAAEAPAVADGRERPAGVFDLPWQKCRGGLGVASGGGGGGGGWEHQEVFFRSLVDGRMAVTGVPGHRFSSPPSKRTLFDDVDAWLAAADDGEVDPLWRSVLEGRHRPAA